MCRAITCKQCKKPSWAGCGAHVESVLGHVPTKDRCCCDKSKSASGGGLFSKLFGG